MRHWEKRTGIYMRCYGYDSTGREIVPEEAEVIRQVVDRLLAGESMRSAVAELRDREVLTSTNRAWTQQSLGRLLRNPRLAGIKTYQGAVVGRGEWPPIITEVKHKKLMRILEDPKRKQPLTTNVRKYLLSGGLLVCGCPLPDDEGDGTHACGKTLYTQPSGSGKRGYVCRGGSPSYGCGRIRIAAEPLEEEVAARALARLASPEVRGRLERAIGAAAAEGEGSVKKALEDLDQRQGEAAEEYARHDISLSSFKLIEKSIDRERKVLKEQLAQAKRLQEAPSASPEALAAWWVDATVERRRELISLVLDHVIVKPATRRGRTRLDPDRLEFIWK